MPSVSVNISRDGKIVTIDNMGFTGTSCEDISHVIASSIGDVIDSKNKPEYYEVIEECETCNN